MEDICNSVHIKKLIKNKLYFICSQYRNIKIIHKNTSGYQIVDSISNYIIKNKHFEILRYYPEKLKGAQRAYVPMLLEAHLMVVFG